MITISIITEGTKVDHTGESFEAKVVVNEFCTLPIDELKAKYGEPNKIREDALIWGINKEEDLKSYIFQEKDERKTAVRFYNLPLKIYFWEELGWDKGTWDVEGKASVMRGLDGISEASYTYQAGSAYDILNIELSGRYKNFGKNR